VIATLAAFALALFASAASATSHPRRTVAISASRTTSRYRTCLRNRRETIRALRPTPCFQARKIARAGLRVDGNDGVHVRLFGFRFQCVTIRRPDHGRHTLVGCYTPSAPPRTTGTSPVVTVLLNVAAN